MVNLHFNTHLWKLRILFNNTAFIQTIVLVHAAVLRSMNELESNTKKEKSFKRPETTSEMNSTGTKRCALKGNIIFFFFFQWVKVFSSFITTLKLYKTLISIKNENFTLNRVVQGNLSMSYSRRVFFIIFYTLIIIIIIIIF